MSDPSRTWAVLLRGVNVGGHRRLGMAELRAALGDAGFAEVRTYVQSGNVVLRGAADERDEPAVATAVRASIAAAFGLDVPVVARPAAEMAALAGTHPFAGCPGATPTRLHVAFVDGAAGDALAAVADRWDGAGGDLLAAGRRELFAFTPAGLGRSRVLTGVERALGVPVTVRNLATVQAVAALCGDRP